MDTEPTLTVESAPNDAIGKFRGNKGNFSENSEGE